MLRFLITRISVIAPTFVAVTFLSFLLIHLVPGDPIETRSGEHGITPERLAELRHQFGLDQPLWQQFLHYEKQVAQRRSRHFDPHAGFGLARVPPTVPGND